MAEVQRGAFCVKQSVKTVIVEGVATSYIEAGAGKEAILFLHGWMDKKESYQELINDLSQKHRCIAIDLPNFGASEESSRIVTVHDYAVFLQRFLVKIHCQNYSVAGHSMGGQIAIYGVGKRTLTPKKLVLLSAAGLRNQNKNMKNLAKMTAKVIGPFVPKTMKRKFYTLVGSDYQSNLSKTHKQVIDSALRSDVRNEASHITVPTLLIYGSNDTATPIWIAKKFAEIIRGAKLIVLETADHFILTKNAKELSRHIKEFLK